MRVLPASALALSAAEKKGCRCKKKKGSRCKKTDAKAAAIYVEIDVEIMFGCGKRDTGEQKSTSTTRPNGSTVYVSVSPDEMYGPLKNSEDSREWDGVPLAKSLHGDHPLKRLLTRRTKAKRALWATERVAYYEDGYLCFQSVTAYGTNHNMMQMQCDSAVSPAKSTKVITNYNWDAKIAIKTACAAKPAVQSLKCPEGSRPHRLAFGLQKCAVRYSKDKPVPLRKQVRGLRGEG